MSVQTCAETRSFLDFAYNLKSKQNKKNPEHTFVGIVKYEAHARFKQNIRLLL